MKRINATRTLLSPAIALSLVVGAVLPTPAANLQWDAQPATAGIQDGAGNWNNTATVTNWFDGTQNLPWVPGDVAVIGFNLTAAATITLTSPIVAGGIILSNNPVSGTAAYTISASAGSSLTLTGNPATIVSAVNYPASPIGGSASDTINASIVAPGGLIISAATPWQTQLTLQSATNAIANTLEIGTPGNASYDSPTALMVQFNTSGIGAGAMLNCSNVIVHTNASWFCRGGAAGFTLLWPKKFIISGDGCFNSSYNFGALMFGSTGANTIFPADVELAGDSTIIGAWGNAGVTIWSNTISGTGRLRFSSSANRPTAGNVIFQGVHTYVGDTIIDGTMTVTLASKANDRLPTGSALTLGTTGAYQAVSTAGVPQSAWNGYGRLVLGDSLGAMNQTIAGLGNDPTLTGTTGCWIIGGNSATNSVLTINNTNDCTYNARLGGSVLPDKNIGLVKQGGGALNLQGVNQCAGGYTVNGGTLTFGDGSTDNSLTGPITNNAAVTINVASSLTYGDVITGSGSFTKDAYGTLTLTGINNYTGATLVQNGKLILGGTLTGGGPLSVAVSAELQINRATVSNVFATASVSLDNAVLDLDLDFNPISPTALAPLSVSGTLTNNGFTTITIQRPGVVSLGSFPIIQYGAYQSNDFSGFTLTPLPGVTATIQNDPANRSLDVVITEITGHQDRWSGATDSNWDTTTVNWLDASSSPTTYSTSDFVLFDDTATGSTAIQINNDPQPSSLTVSNSIKAYSFNGSQLTVSSPLIKQGAGTLTVALNNTSTGGTQIQGGMVQVGDGVNEGTISSPILDNGSLVLNELYNSSYSDITGTGSLTKTGPGQVTLGGNSTYQGATTVQQGALYLHSSTALGATNGGTTIQPGSELWLDMDGLNIPEQITLGGMGLGGSDGALNVSSAVVTAILSGNIATTADTGIMQASGTTLTLSGLVNATTNALIFAPNGNASVNLSSNVTAGSLILNGSGAVRLFGSNHLNQASVIFPGTMDVFNSKAFGTNCIVGITNEITPGIYSSLVLASNATIPAGVILSAEAPGGAPNAYRTALTFGGGAIETNIWNGPITLTGVDVFDTGLPGYLVAACNSGLAVINGNITVPPGQTVNIQLRGSGTGGVVNGQINLDTNNLTRTDTTPWTITSASNIWGLTLIFGGPLLVGTNDALPVTTSVRLDIATSILDLNGFTQHLAGLYNNNTAIWGNVISSSTNHSAALVYTGSNSVFGGGINAMAGAQPLSLDIFGNLTLTAASTYSGSTTVRPGAVLALTGNGTIAGTKLIDVQSSGSLDYSAANNPTIAAGQTVTGNGTVAGNLVVAGTINPGETIGILNVNGGVTFTNSGAAVMEVNNSLAINDLLSVNGGITYGGTLVVTNTSGSAYTVNQVIKLFQANSYTGSFANIVFPGVGSFDASQLTVDGSIKVTSLVVTTPPLISFAAGSGGNVQLSWPADHTGWRLLMQTNNLAAGVSRNLADYGTVAGSQSTNSVALPVDATKPDEFYLLVYP